MNLSWKIIFWILTIGLGFVNPVITFVMIILYYLPGVLQSICNDSAESDSQTVNKSESPQNHTRMKTFSDDTIEEFR